ncbi:MAG: hypothetical protein E3J47_05170 [Candidatus Stahlbacteria bacterium]|nr:MAG: hypothetical protein E3J47_05170 [Candidatus Stahlbacteria bacterium]
MKRRYAARTDTNQSSIVEALLKIPGVSVETDHDDIFVGFRNINYWYEIKNSDVVSKKTGKVYESCKQDGQKTLEKTWNGHYKIVSSLNEILIDMGIIK